MSSSKRGDDETPLKEIWDMTAQIKLQMKLVDERIKEARRAVRVPIDTGSKDAERGSVSALERRLIHDQDRRNSDLMYSRAIGNGDRIYQPVATDVSTSSITDQAQLYTVGELLGSRPSASSSDLDALRRLKIMRPRSALDQPRYCSNFAGDAGFTSDHSTEQIMPSHFIRPSLATNRIVTEGSTGTRADLRPRSSSPALAKSVNIDKETPIRKLLKNRPGDTASIATTTGFDLAIPKPRVFSHLKRRSTGAFDTLEIPAESFTSGQSENNSSRAGTSNGAFIRRLALKSKTNEQLYGLKRSSASSSGTTGKSRNSSDSVTQSSGTDPSLLNQGSRQITSVSSAISDYSSVSLSSNVEAQERLNVRQEVTSSASSSIQHHSKNGSKAEASRNGHSSGTSSLPVSVRTTGDEHDEGNLGARTGSSSSSSSSSVDEQGNESKPLLRNNRRVVSPPRQRRRLVEKKENDEQERNNETGNRRTRSYDSAVIRSYIERKRKERRTTASCQREQGELAIDKRRITHKYAHEELEEYMKMKKDSDSRERKRAMERMRAAKMEQERRMKEILDEQKKRQRVPLTMMLGGATLPETSAGKEEASVRKDEPIKRIEGAKKMEGVEKVEDTKNMDQVRRVQKVENIKKVESVKEPKSMSTEELERRVNAIRAKYNSLNGERNSSEVSPRNSGPASVETDSTEDYTQMDDDQNGNIDTRSLVPAISCSGAQTDADIVRNGGSTWTPRNGHSADVDEYNIVNTILRKHPYLRVTTLYTPGLNNGVGGTHEREIAGGSIEQDKKHRSPGAVHSDVPLRDRNAAAMNGDQGRSQDPNRSQGTAIEYARHQQSILSSPPSTIVDAGLASVSSLTLSSDEQSSLAGSILEIGGGRLQSEKKDENGKRATVENGEASSLLSVSPPDTSNLRLRAGINYLQSLQYSLDQIEAAKEISSFIVAEQRATTATDLMRANSAAQQWENHLREARMNAELQRLKADVDRATAAQELRLSTEMTNNQRRLMDTILANSRQQPNRGHADTMIGDESRAPSMDTVNIAAVAASAATAATIAALRSRGDKRKTGSGSTSVSSNTSIESSLSPASVSSGNGGRSGSNGSLLTPSAPLRMDTNMATAKSPPLQQTTPEIVSSIITAPLSSSISAGTNTNEIPTLTDRSSAVDVPTSIGRTSTNEVPTLIERSSTIEEVPTLTGRSDEAVTERSSASIPEDIVSKVSTDQSSQTSPTRSMVGTESREIPTESVTSNKGESSAVEQTESGSSYDRPSTATGSEIATVLSLSTGTNERENSNGSSSTPLEESSIPEKPPVSSGMVSDEDSPVPTSTQFESTNRKHCLDFEKLAADYNFSLSFSDTSDHESRIQALRSNLDERRRVAEKLKQEYKRRVKSSMENTEKSLLNQLNAYDTFIEKTEKELTELKVMNVAGSSIQKRRSVTPPRIMSPRTSLDSEVSSPGRRSTSSSPRSARPIKTVIGRAQRVEHESVTTEKTESVESGGEGVLGTELELTSPAASSTPVASSTPTSTPRTVASHSGQKSPTADVGDAAFRAGGDLGSTAIHGENDFEDTAHGEFLEKGIQPQRQASVDVETADEVSEVLDEAAFGSSVGSASVSGSSGNFILSRPAENEKSRTSAPALDDEKARTQTATEDNISSIDVDDSTEKGREDRISIGENQTDIFSVEDQKNGFSGMNENGFSEEKNVFSNEDRVDIPNKEDPEDFFNQLDTAHLDNRSSHDWNQQLDSHDLDPVPETIPGSRDDQSDALPSTDRSGTCVRTPPHSGRSTVKSTTKSVSEIGSGTASEVSTARDDDEEKTMSPVSTSSRSPSDEAALIRKSGGGEGIEPESGDKDAFNNGSHNDISTTETSEKGPESFAALDKEEKLKSQSIRSTDLIINSILCDTITHCLDSWRVHVSKIQSSNINGMIPSRPRVINGDKDRLVGLIVQDTLMEALDDAIRSMIFAGKRQVDKSVAEGSVVDNDTLTDKDSAVIDGKHLENVRRLVSSVDSEKGDGSCHSTGSSPRSTTRSPRTPLSDRYNEAFRQPSPRMEMQDIAKTTPLPFPDDSIGEVDEQWMDDDFGLGSADEDTFAGLTKKPISPRSERLDLSKFTTEIFSAVPSTKAVVHPIVDACVQALVDQHRPGDLPSSSTKPSFLYTVGRDEANVKDLELRSNKESDETYRDFLFDLCREIVEDIYEERNDGNRSSLVNGQVGGNASMVDSDQKRPRWKKPPRLRFSSYSKLRPRNLDHCQSIVRDVVSSYLDLDPEKTHDRIGRLKSISRRTLDRVDELVLEELYNEENEWTVYDDDELLVKLQLADDIMQTVLNEALEKAVGKEAKGSDGVHWAQS